MSIRRTRYLLILFVAGFSWGYMAKSFIGKNAYIGHDDPQVIESAGVYKIKRSVASESAENDSIEIFIDPSATPGTIGL